MPTPVIKYVIPRALIDVPPTLKQRREVPAGGGPATCELPKTHLHKEQRHADYSQHEDEGDEEGTPSVPVTQVGEAPDVPQPHGVSQHGQHEVHPPAPVAPLLVLVNAIHDPRLHSLGGRPRLHRQRLWGLLKGYGGGGCLMSFQGVWVFTGFYINIILDVQCMFVYFIKIYLFDTIKVISLFTFHKVQHNLYIY